MRTVLIAVLLFVAIVAACGVGFVGGYYFAREEIRQRVEAVQHEIASKFAKPAKPAESNPSYPAGTKLVVHTDRYMPITYFDWQKYIEAVGANDDHGIGELSTEKRVIQLRAGTSVLSLGGVAEGWIKCRITSGEHDGKTCIANVNWVQTEQEARTQKSEPSEGLLVLTASRLLPHTVSDMEHLEDANQSGDAKAIDKLLNDQRLTDVAGGSSLRLLSRINKTWMKCEVVTGKSKGLICIVNSSWVKEN